MSLFVIHNWDGPDAPRLRQKHLAAHLAYAETVVDRIAVGGPLRDGDRYLGSLIIADVADEAAARVLLENDPYHAAGVWEQSEIAPFRAVIGGWIGGKSW